MKLRQRTPRRSDVESLRKKCLQLTQALGKRPTVAELTQVTELVEELVEAGHWPALETLASLYGKLIWVTLDWGEDDAETVPPEQKKKIFDYAMRGLLSLNAFAEKKGRRIDAESAARIKSYGDEFKKYIEMTKPDQHWSFGNAR